MRLLYSSTLTSSFLHKIEIPISFSALMFMISGTSDATSFSLFDVGRIRYQIRGQTFVEADFDMLAHLTNLWYGAPRLTGTGYPITASTAYNVAVMIPRSFFDDNLEHITREDQATFQITFGANVAAHTGSGFLAELYAIEDQGFQAYNLKLIQDSIAITGATVQPMNVAHVENICAAYVSGRVTNALNLAGSNISRLAYSLGGEAGEMSMAGCLAATNMFNQMEVYDGRLGELFSKANGDLSSKLEDSYDARITASGVVSSVELLSVGLQFNPNKLAETSARVAQLLSNKIEQKQNVGKGRSVDVLRTIAGWGGRTYKPIQK